MDFDKEINLDELAKNINMRRELEAQETTSEPVQEYLNMDKITLVKMLLASKEENKKLHDKLDKLREEAQEREAKAEARNEELMRANRRQMEYQVKLMDQLTEMQRQLNKTTQATEGPQQAGPQRQVRYHQAGRGQRRER